MDGFAKKGQCSIAVKLSDRQLSNKKLRTGSSVAGKALSGMMDAQAGGHEREGWSWKLMEGM